jgi:hypothetical protein
MIQPVLKDDAFLADVRAANNDTDDFRLWWLGQSGSLVHWKRATCCSIRICPTR